LKKFKSAIDFFKSRSKAILKFIFMSHPSLMADVAAKPSFLTAMNNAFAQTGGVRTPLIANAERWIHKNKILKNPAARRGSVFGIKSYATAILASQEKGNSRKSKNLNLTY